MKDYADGLAVGLVSNYADGPAVGIALVHEQRLVATWHTYADGRAVGIVLTKPTARPSA